MSEGESASKEQRTTESVQNEMNVPGVSNSSLPRLLPVSLPPIFKLTTDCCDDIFEYLTLEDLHSFAQTCKAMNRVAGEYFKRNYSAEWFDIDKRGLHSNRSLKRNGRLYKIVKYLPGFDKYITKAHFHHRVIDSSFIKRSEEFTSIKHLRFRYFILDKKWWIAVKSILPRIETLDINGIRLLGDKFLGNEFHSVDDFYAKLLGMGVNLRGLNVDLPYVNMATDIENYAFMHQNYPKLKTFGFEPTPPVDDLSTFFKLNPNVCNWRKTGLSLQYIRENKERLLNSTINLDVLVVVDCSRNLKEDFTQTIDFFNELYRRRFYKRLHLRCDIPHPLIQQLSNLQGLEKLSLWDKLSCVLPVLTNLKQLDLDAGSELTPKDMEISSRNLMNIEHIYIRDSKVDDFLPFIRQSPKLAKIKILPENETESNGRIINLSKLNKEREMLLNARRVTIYVKDYIYVPTVWATNGDTNRKLVEMRRIGSFEWDSPELFSF